MTAVDAALAAAVDEFFADQAPSTRDAPGFPAALWAQAEELGLTRVGVPEEHGGSGGSLADLLTVLLSAARHAVPLPLAETHLAAQLLARAGVEAPPGVLTIPLGGSLTVAGGTVSGTLHEAPWAGSARWVVAPATDETGAAYVVALDPSAYDAKPGVNLAGEPIATLPVAGQPAACVPANADPADHFWLGALCRTAQIAGALRAVVDLTLRYTGERVQFGKPIGRFQAVQQHIVTVAQAAEITTTALWTAARDGSTFAVCAAKLTADESARVAARAAHQAHGAIGMTREYPLHLFTRRLNLWRHHLGTERQLAAVLGQAVSQAPSFAHLLSGSDGEPEVPCPT